MLYFPEIFHTFISKTIWEQTSLLGTYFDINLFYTKYRAIQISIFFNVNFISCVFQEM